MLRKLLLMVCCAAFVPGFSQEGKELSTYYSKGLQHLYTNKDSTYFYLNKTIALADKIDQIEYISSAYTYLLYANGFYFELENFKTNLDRYASFIDCDPRFETSPDREYYKTKLWVANGNYYYKLGNYEKAEVYFLKAYQSWQKITVENLNRNQVSIMSSSLTFLAAIYERTKRYGLAEDFYLKTLELLKYTQAKGYSPESRKILTQVNLAELYQSQKNYEKAAGMIRRALPFYRSDAGKPYLNSAISAYHLLAKNNLLQQKPDSALMVLSSIDARIDHENLRFYRDQIRYKAEAYVQKNNFEQALSQYQKALELTRAYYQTEQHPELAEIYGQIGELYAEKGNREKSLANFSRAFSALSASGEALSAPPDPKKVSSKLVLLKVLGQQQAVLNDAYAASQELDYLKMANKTGKSIVKTLEALKPEFESKVDMQFLLEETFPAFDQMIQTAFLLYQKTGTKTALEDAFYYSEKSKAVLLLAAVQATNASKFAGVPDSVVVQEQRYLAEINHLERNQYKNPNDPELRANLFSKKAEFRVFLEQLKTEYPNYYSLKATTEVATLDEIQKLLHPEEGMLSYHLGDGFLYYFLLTKDTVAFDRVPFGGEATKKSTQLRELLSRPSVTKIKELKSLGNSIYQTVLPELPPSLSTLIIVRKGVLNYLPFEALYDSAQAEYLVEKYAISYANSATLYREYAGQNPTENRQLLALAPSFETIASSTNARDRAQLGPLLYNKKEAKLIANYFDGTTLLDEAASLQAFENKAKTYDMVHLATHAIINDQFPDYSYLAFSPDGNEENQLYIKDLYNYKLKARLVTLSACETGIGELQKGAGMLSLASGFNYAGATSLVTTQWQINDKSTAELMDTFYKNLAEGKPKNVALRNAKLAYLHNTDDPMQRHPYYWAGFVLTGNISPVAATTSSAGWFAGASILILAVAGAVFWRYQRQRKRASQS